MRITAVDQTSTHKPTVHIEGDKLFTIISRHPDRGANHTTVLAAIRNVVAISPQDAAKDRDVTMAVALLDDCRHAGDSTLFLDLADWTVEAR